VSRIYALYDDVVVEVVEREKNKTLIKISNYSYKWVNESDVTIWKLPDFDSVLAGSQGYRGQKIN
jgi:hypothetical protein